MPSFFLRCFFLSFLLTTGGGGSTMNSQKLGQKAARVRGISSRKTQPQKKGGVQLIFEHRRNRAWMLEHSMGARNRVGTELSYRLSSSLCSLAESVPWNRFLGFLNPMPESTLSPSQGRWFWVDSKTLTMGNAMPELTLSPSQGLRIWPLVSFLNKLTDEGSVRNEFKYSKKALAS